MCEESKDMWQDLLNRYWECRNKEYDFFWGRLSFVGVFLTLLFSGYGAILLKMCELVSQRPLLNTISIAVLYLGTILSMCWCLIIKTSKYWCEVHEKAIGFIETYKLKQMSGKTFYPQAFLKKDFTLQEDESFLTHQPVRYSLFSLMHLLGMFSFFMFMILCGFHILLISRYGVPLMDVFVHGKKIAIFLLLGFLPLSFWAFRLYVHEQCYRHE